MSNEKPELALPIAIVDNSREAIASALDHSQGRRSAATLSVDQVFAIGRRAEKAIGDLRVPPVKMIGAKYRYPQGGPEAKAYS